VAGTVAGTSIDLAKLGAEVYAMGAIGEDELGNFPLTTMERYGIDTNCLIRKLEVQTSSTRHSVGKQRPNVAIAAASANMKKKPKEGTEACCICRAKSGAGTASSTKGAQPPESLCHIRAKNQSFILMRTRFFLIGLCKNVSFAFVSAAAQHMETSN